MVFPNGIQPNSSLIRTPKTSEVKTLCTKVTFFKSGVYKTTKGLQEAEEAMAVYYDKAKALYNTNKLTPKSVSLETW